MPSASGVCPSCWRGVLVTTYRAGTWFPFGHNVSVNDIHRGCRCDQSAHTLREKGCVSSGSARAPGTGCWLLGVAVSGSSSSSVWSLSLLPLPRGDGDTMLGAALSWAPHVSHLHRPRRNAAGCSSTYLPPAKGKTWGIFCHCQTPKFPSEALAVLMRGAVTWQVHISTLLSSVQCPGAQPLAVPPRPSSRRQRCCFSSSDFVTLEGKASLGMMFRQISWGNSWLPSLTCELLHP